MRSSTKEAVQMKLCPVHRGTIAMSGRIAHTPSGAPGPSHLGTWESHTTFATSSPAPYRLNCRRIANKNSANNDDVSSVSMIATTRPRG